MFVNDVISLKQRIGHTQQILRSKTIVANWIALYVNRDKVVYFDSFCVEYILRN